MLVLPTKSELLASLPYLNAQERAELDRLIATPAPSATSPLEWARTNATIVHPARGRIAFEPYAYQAEFLNNYQSPRRIVLKARQIGYSQVFALEALYVAITEPESTTLLVSRSQDLAVNLLRYCYLTYNNLRDAPELDKANESEMGFTTGARIKSIPANRSTGRGFAANRVYLDEFAYADYAEDIYQSISPTISQGGHIVIGSTPNGVSNLFHALYMAGEGFDSQRVTWRDCPAYYTPEEQAAGIAPEQCAWYLRERPKYTTQQWASEYECDFVGSGDAVFTQADIDAAEIGAIGDQPHQRNHNYLTSVDVGRRRDATVINTFDVTVRPFQRVAHERIEQLPYPLIQERIEQRWHAYGGELRIESNGPGDPVIENLTVPALPFVTSAKSKMQAIQSTQLLLQQRKLKVRWTAQERKEMTLYRWDDKKLTQDCVMSLVIAGVRLAEIENPATDWSDVADLGNVEEYQSRWQ